MPIEELMKMYTAAENESTDLQSDDESSQESTEEGRVNRVFNKKWSRWQNLRSRWRETERRRRRL